MIEIRIDEGHPLLGQELVFQRSLESRLLLESQQGLGQDMFQIRHSHPRRHDPQEFPARSGEASRKGYCIHTAYRCEWLHVPHMDRSPVTYGLKPGFRTVVSPHRGRLGGKHDLSARVRSADPQVIRVQYLHLRDIRRLKLPSEWLRAERPCHHQHIGIPFI